MRVLITEPDGFSEKAASLLSDAGHKVTLEQHSGASLLKVVDRYEAVFVRLGLHLDSRFFEISRNLQYVVSPTTGLDHIDLLAAKEADVAVLSLQGERDFLDKITPTAEHAVLLILMLRRRVLEAIDSVEQGIWDRTQFIGSGLNGAVVGIVGLGRLGSMVARQVETLGARVYYFDPNVVDDQYTKVDSLIELAGLCEVVSAHVPLSELTEGMFDDNFFRACRRDSFFVNTSRGDLVNESALLSALQVGRIAGAGLDVVSGEVGKTKLDSPLIKYASRNSNLIVTPHIGGATRGAMENVEIFMVEKLLKVMNGVELERHVVESR